MAKRRHVSKRPIEQQYYVQRISKSSYEATAEDIFEVPDFPDSDQLEESTTLPTSGTRRSRSAGERITEHFKQNGAIWIIAFITILLTISIPFLVNLNGSVERMEATIDGIKDSLNRQEAEIKDMENKIHDQELKLQEQQIKMNYLEKELEKTK